MNNQPLEASIPGEGRFINGHFPGTLFECCQTSSCRDNESVSHYPVAILNPAKSRIRCEICFQSVENIAKFWQSLFETEMYYSHQSPEKSLMHLVHTNVFSDSGELYYIPIFVFNPLYYLFYQRENKIELTEIRANAEGFADWRGV